MDGPKAIIAVTVGIIVATTVLSGPLVGAVDLTTEPNGEERLLEATTHGITVQVIEEPKGPVVLDRGEFGNDVYRLLVPPVTVRVTNVQGNPTVTYKVRIFGLGYTRVGSYILDADTSPDERTLEVTETTFPPERVTESQYNATLSVTVHDTAGSRVVFQTNTTVVVRE